MYIIVDAVHGHAYRPEEMTLIVVHTRLHQSAMQNEYGNRMGRQGPPIDNYKTQQEFLSQQTAGGMEFRDCQNPDASDGYIVGPNEKVTDYNSVSCSKRLQLCPSGAALALSGVCPSLATLLSPGARIRP